METVTEADAMILENIRMSTMAIDFMNTGGFGDSNSLIPKDDFFKKSSSVHKV